MAQSTASKTILFWAAIIILGVFLWRLTTSNRDASTLSLSYSDFLAHVEKGNIKEITLDIRGDVVRVYGMLRQPPQAFRSTIPRDSIPQLTQQLREKGSSVTVASSTKSDWMTFLMNAVPLFLLVGFVIFMMRQAKKGKKSDGGPSQ